MENQARAARGGGGEKQREPIKGLVRRPGTSFQISSRKNYCHGLIGISVRSQFRHASRAPGADQKYLSDTP